MASDAVDARVVAVEFTGSRRQLLSVLLRGYVLLVPTIGLYRFWLTTMKRQFYWGNTYIGKDALEYTGQARQLLIGFLMALAFFVPLYGLFFYFSTLSQSAAIVGYGGVAVLVWFMMGYAIYRGRDFRLSRTLWRGIRCDQTGNPWAYALRRFFWSIAVVASLGLAYPFMTANLWRYRYEHCFFGDQRFSFHGSWKHVALRYYLAWGAGVVITVAGLVTFSSFGDSMQTYVVLAVLAVAMGVTMLRYQAFEASTMFSRIGLGDTRVAIKIGAWPLISLYLGFAIALAVTYIALAFGGFLVLSLLVPEAFMGGNFQLEVLLADVRGDWLTLAAIFLGYLLVFGAFTLLAELFIGLGYWRLVARGASITGIYTLANVKARAEDKALAGEGLADALNVGGY
jgi:hypothetical protein